MKKIQPLIDFFEKHLELSSEEKAYLKERIPVIAPHKDLTLLKEGDVSSEFYFIIKGGIRLFYNVGDVEKTAFFYFENKFVSSYESFTKQTPSKHNLQTIEDTTIAVFKHEVVYKLLELFPRFEFLGRIMMEEELIVCQDIIASFISLNAEERYLKLIDTNNELIQRIPQHQLAPYLGVTAETLSRIRKRISKK
jgi:CRP-like cAMP-binding protein